MEKIWLSQYDEGVPEYADVTAYSSISAVFNESAAQYGQRPAFTNMGKTLTYAETKQYVDQFSAYLQNVLKLPKGERVAIMPKRGVWRFPGRLCGGKRQPALHPARIGTPIGRLWRHHHCGVGKLCQHTGLGIEKHAR